ncbi:MAG: hypothetical protein RL437_72 [Actinomycetota bacterium]|jgi:apolipoprotein N-acyltransferase
MNWALAFLSGLIASAAFHPINFWPAIFIGIGLLYKLNLNQLYKKRLAINLYFGIGYQIFTLYWIGTYVGSLAWIALVLMQSTFFMVLSFAKRPFEFAISWILAEFILRSFPFGGFGWSRIGYALTESPLNSIYPRVGIVGIAFLVVWISSEIAKRELKKPLSIAAAILALSFLPVSIAKGETIDIALVQGGQNEKLDNTFENAENALERHFEVTNGIKAENLDLVIWPENAIAHDPLLRKSTRTRLEAEISRLSSPILVNGNLADGTNGSVLIGDEEIQSYSKRYLTPFGEFIPFQSLVEKINDKAGKVIPYIPGQSPYLFNSESGKFRTLICYELLSDKQARTEMADSEFIVVQTNNATYFKTWQLEQELAIAQARSAETSRESAYVSTTGGTSIIDSRGRIQKSLEKYENRALIGQVQKRSGITPATKYGSTIETLIIGAGLLLLLNKSLRTFRT